MTAWDPKIPDAPDAWLITTARRRALDCVRADQTLARKSPEIAYFIAHEQSDPEEAPVTIPDKRLEMLFTCCHPSLDVKTPDCVDSAHFGRADGRGNCARLSG